MRSNIKTKLSFRNDILGLRGWAILFVLIYHFFPTILPKGYLGVDIFFVISGFLITSIFLTSKHYSYSEFIKKRIIRLVPSILVTILLCIVVSLIIFLPFDLKNLSNSTIYSLILVPNFYFLLNGGYFGGINELKPLLHFWSLGIEIQFYIFYPLFLIFIKNQFKSHFLLFILLISIISFSLNFFFISYDKINFFMLPNRIWQFCLGSSIFFLLKLNYNIKYNNYFNYLFISVIILVVLFDFHFSNLFLKLIICIFVGLIIFFGQNISNYNFLFNNIFINFFGKISFSLYLIHWPILVFFKYYLIRKVSNLESLILMLLTVLFSYFFWRLVEYKFHKQLKPSVVFKSSLFGFVVIFLTLFVFYLNNFFPNRVNNEANLISESLNSNYRCNKINFFLLKKFKPCQIIFNNAKSTNDIILIGNSHAQMYGYVFENFLKRENSNGLIVALNACLPTIKYNISKDCMEKAKKNLNSIIEEQKVKKVIIGLDWDHHTLIDDNNMSIKNEENILLVSAIFDLIKIFEKNNIETILIGPISTPNFEFPSVVSRSLYFYNEKDFPNFNENLEEFETRFKNTFNFFDKNNYNKIIKPHLIQCKNKNCIFSIAGRSLFSDNTHLSKFGSLFMEKAFIDVLNNNN